MKKKFSQNQAKDATTNSPNAPITKDEDGREQHHTGSNQSAEKTPLPPYQINMDPHLRPHPLLFPGVLGTLVRTNCHFSRPCHRLKVHTYLYTQVWKKYSNTRDCRCKYRGTWYWVSTQYFSKIISYHFTYIFQILRQGKLFSASPFRVRSKGPY